MSQSAHLSSAHVRSVSSTSRPAACAAMQSLTHASSAHLSAHANVALQAAVFTHVRDSLQHEVRRQVVQLTSPSAGEHATGTPPGPVPEVALSVAPVANSPGFLAVEVELLSRPQATPSAATPVQRNASENATVDCEAPI